eukprot:TRINITY_DN2049_c0_g2_i1.p1 TRINITY_DN2049_c0_g2~~TRINITY_DN2049_c0_g2_i1.p1  ORF type:complete len:267 (+),score=59.13 TRINITY_DN2049_c0_g2_i1:192-992(+)
MPAPIPRIAGLTKMPEIKNDVNVKRKTLRLERDSTDPHRHLVCFTFNAGVSGSICIFFVAKEGEGCSFTPLHPNKFSLQRIPFSAGLGLEFRQEPGTGVDLAAFEESELLAEGKSVYPLVIQMETDPKNPPPDANPHLEEPPGAKLPPWIHCQTTYAVLEKEKTEEGKGADWNVRPLKQRVWVGGQRYELQEIYGMASSDGEAEDGLDVGKECVICLSAPRAMTAFPCRHMTFRSDNGGEFMNRELTNFFTQEGILHERTIPHTPK